MRHRPSATKLLQRPRIAKIKARLVKWFDEAGGDAVVRPKLLHGIEEMLTDLGQRSRWSEAMTVALDNSAGLAIVVRGTRFQSIPCADPQHQEVAEAGMEIVQVQIEVRDRWRAIASCSTCFLSRCFVLITARIKWNRGTANCLRAKMEGEWTPQMMEVLGIEAGSLPIIWDADFLYGPSTASGEDTYVLCEINVSSCFALPEQAPAAIARLALRRSNSARHENRPDPNPPIFLINSILRIKEGAMNAAIRASWVDACTQRHLRPLIGYLRPAAVVGMGNQGWRAVLQVFRLVRAPRRISLAAGSCWSAADGIWVFAVGHCSPLGIINRPWSQQIADWRRIGEVIRENCPGINANCS